jgi:hypothetical protein
VPFKGNEAVVFIVNFRGTPTLMKKLQIVIAAVLLSTALQAQFKVLKFGVKGGVNYPQASLSAQDLLTIYNDQTFDISNIQTDVTNGFNFGGIARISLPLVPAYIHGEALYTQFNQNLIITDNGQQVDLSTTVQRLDFPISAGMKFGPAWAGLGMTPSIPIANASDIWSPNVDATFTWGWHIHAGLKVWRLLGEIKYEGGFGMLAQNVNYNYNGNDYNFDLDARNSQLVVSLGYFFK